MKRRYAFAFAAAASALSSAALGGCGNDKPAPGEAPATMVTAPDGTRELFVTVDEHGYTPGSLSAPAGQKVRLTFKRTTDEGCGQQVAFPSLNLRRDLPLNKQVSVDLTMPASGSLAFQCGMGMYRGAVVVQ